MRDFDWIEAVLRITRALHFSVHDLNFITLPQATSLLRSAFVLHTERGSESRFLRGSVHCTRWLTLRDGRAASWSLKRHYLTR